MRALTKRLSGVELLPPARAFARGQGRRYLLNEPEYADKDTALGEHLSASRG